MFQHQADLNRIELPARQVARIYKSIGSAQVAMPGYPAQPVSASLCAFATTKGIRAVVGLHLESTGKLVLYMSDKTVPKERLQRLVDEGLQFVESMGIFLDDVEFHRMTPPQREAYWKDFVLSTGVKPPKKAPSESSSRQEEIDTGAEAPAPELTGADLTSSEESSTPPPPDRAGSTLADAAPIPLPQERVSAPSTPEEARRRKLLDSVGRFLASL